MELVNNGAAYIIEEKDLSGEVLCNKVKELVADPKSLKETGKKAQDMAIKDASSKITDIILELLNR